MQKLNLDLENCYGIRKLKETLDFGDGASYAIYAPNGSMKSSLYQTLKDLSQGEESRDRIFPERATTRTITTESNTEIDPQEIVVIGPYDATYENDKTSTLLVDAARRKEYEKLMADVEAKQSSLLNALAKQAKTKTDVAAEIQELFGGATLDFAGALQNLQSQLSDDDIAYSNLQYDIIFAQTTIEFLGLKDNRTLIGDYIENYNKLIAKSTYFSRQAFSYYGANKINDNLSDHGFFDAKHKLVLNGGTSLEVTSAKQLNDLINEEKKKISDDPAQRKRYADIEKALAKNKDMRAFQDYLDQHQVILPDLTDIPAFKKKAWKSYASVHRKMLDQYLDTKKAVDQAKLKIEGEAAKQATQWEQVLRVFNSRFSVPFRLEATNKSSVVLGKAPLEIRFIFKDADGEREVNRELLQDSLSQGERKALYILNVIFEVEARKKEEQPTLFVFDDIADSFDYKNKYAIIQYLQDIAKEPSFKLLVLTHNFDFFRTIERRFVHRNRCKTAIRSNDGLKLYPVDGIRNIFINDWKKQFDEDPKKRIACIAFMRNMLEYLRGEGDPEFIKLTSLLHWRPDTEKIVHKELDDIFNTLFGKQAKWDNQTATIVSTIFEEAEKCLLADDAVNMQNKIVLSVAIRLTAERFMANKIADPAFFNAITGNQTRALYERYRKDFHNPSTIEIIDRVLLMTPENIHLNSFMYEPIMDMSDHHLRSLYKDVKKLG